MEKQLGLCCIAVDVWGLKPVVVQIAHPIVTYAALFWRHKTRLENNTI